PSRAEPGRTLNSDVPGTRGAPAIRCLGPRQPSRAAARTSPLAPLLRYRPEKSANGPQEEGAREDTSRLKLPVDQPLRGHAALTVLAPPLNFLNRHRPILQVPEPRPNVL